jgi:hypothetical protein
LVTVKIITTVKSAIKQNKCESGDRLKIDCQDEEHGFRRIAAYHCSNPQKSDEILKPFDFHIDRVRDFNL